MFPWSGELFSLLSALAWAFAVVLFKRSGETTTPIALNLFKNVVGLALLAVSLPLAMRLAPFPPEALGETLPRDILLLVLSGIIGIALADTAFFYSLRLVGVGIVSVVDCSYTPFVILFSWILLGDALDPLQYAGTALILVGVLVSSRHAPLPDRTAWQMAGGVLVGTLGMVLMALGIVMVKRVLEVWPTIPATLVRLLAGTAALALFVSFTRERCEVWRVFRPSRTWHYLLPASVLGSYVALLLWIAGYKYTQHASVAAVLNQTTVIFMLLLATVWLREPLTGRKLLAISLAAAGVLLVTLNDAILALIRTWGTGL